MDKYCDCITKHKFQFNPSLVNVKPQYKELIISFEEFKTFIDKYGDIVDRLPLLKINIYDEDIIYCRDQIYLRYKFLTLINKLNILNIEFKLSDSTLPVYIKMLNCIGWKHQKNTQFFLKTDRNPVPVNERNLGLQDAKGKLLLPSDKLIWCSYETLSKLGNKVDGNVLKTSVSLKKLVDSYWHILNKLYYVEELTDFDKIMLIYLFIY